MADFKVERSIQALMVTGLRSMRLRFLGFDFFNFPSYSSLTMGNL